jgi:hypothetical protein
VHSNKKNKKFGITIKTKKSSNLDRHTLLMNKATLF